MNSSRSLPGFYRTLLVIAVPIILQNLLQTFVNMLDTIMVGSLGSVAIAAVGLGNQIFFVLNMVLFGISSGGSVFIAQYWGKKDIRGIQHTLGITLSLSCIVSCIFTIGAVCFPGYLLGLYTQDPAVLSQGVRYLRIAGISYPLMAVSFAYQLAYRSTEHVYLPLVATGVSFALNFICNYLFIFGRGSVIPAYGVAGAAIATVISRFVELCITTIYPSIKRFEAAGSLRNIFSFNRYVVFRFLKIAFPVIVNETLWGLGITLQNSIFAHAGTKFIASFNITGTISQLTWVVFIGIGNGAAIIIGKKIGSGNVELARRYAHRLAWFTPLCGACIGTLLLPLSHLLPYLFKVEPGITADAARMMIVLMCYYPLQAFNLFLIVGMCRSGGDTVFGAFNDLFWMWCAGLPLGAAAAFLWHLDAWQIYAFLLSENIFKAVLGIWRIRSGRWLHDVT